VDLYVRVDQSITVTIILVKKVAKRAIPITEERKAVPITTTTMVGRILLLHPTRVNPSVIHKLYRNGSNKPVIVVVLAAQVI